MNSLQKSKLITWFAGTLLVVALLTTGCATRTFVPLANGGKVDVEQRSATRTDGDTTVTVVGSAWKGEPFWLEEVVTPVYAVVENRGTSSIGFGHGDLAVFDEQRVQYPALPPETVASRVRSLGRSYGVAPPPSFFTASHFAVGHFRRPLFWRGPFWPWWYEPWPDPPNVSEIYAQALPTGSVRPNARVQGFIYFTRPPTTAQRMTVSFGYERSGEPGRREVTFPFVIQEKSTR